MKKTSSNKNLKSANRAKSDEFYTQLSDIEKELGNYKDHLKNKVIFDGRNIYEPDVMKKLGFYYESIGRKIIK